MDRSDEPLLVVLAPDQKTGRDYLKRRGVPIAQALIPSSASIAEGLSGPFEVVELPGFRCRKGARDLLAVMEINQVKCGG